jgi:hypothetical protein
MLEEFRALGGTVDNICLRDGAYGRGVFPIDPSRPVSIHIPDELLVDTSDVGFEGGQFRVTSGSSLNARQKAFLESYEALFSWGGGGRAETAQVFEQAQTLPEELRALLRSDYRCGDWFENATEVLTQERFMESRRITYRDRTVVMPIIELVNHGAGASYDLEDGVALQGTFPGEVLVKYSDTDAFGMFANWGFAAEQPQAFGIELNGSVGQTRLRIGRDITGLADSARVWMPELSTIADGAELPFLMIGNRQYPRLCKGIFYKVMRDAELSGWEEAFDTIQHVNRMHFLALLTALEGVGGPMAQTLRRMARFQLQAMSFSYGVRAI